MQWPQFAAYIQAMGKSGEPSAPSRDKLLDPALKDIPSQKDTAMAFKAFYADIGPQPHHLPLVAAAGMNFLEPDHVTELNLHDYSKVTVKKRDWIKSD